MPINNFDAFAASLWDWGIFAGCFGRNRSSFGDIDGGLERHGNVVCLEAKGPGKPLSRAQEGLLAAFVAAGFTVIVIWGRRHQPERLRWWTLETSFECEANLFTLRTWVAHWWRYADQGHRGVVPVPPVRGPLSSGEHARIIQGWTGQSPVEEARIRAVVDQPALSHDTMAHLSASHSSAAAR